VYEHLTFDVAHIPVATLPGAAERTITISSAGKTFSCTGWKVGWVCGPPPLVAAVTRVKQFLTYTNAAPLQPAIARALRLPSTYYTELAAGLRGKRDLLSEGLAAAGFGVHQPAGTYFVTADISPLGESDGMAFCRSLPERCGVVAVPVQVFYDDPKAGQSLVRFAFCKRADVLTEAVRRLQRL
jgi:N-succinyldiaminopimelate aminotransferase